MPKQGSIAVAVIAVILALIILGLFLFNIAQRECNNNSQCSSEAYCGSDHECHEFPEEIVVKENTYIPAAIIFGAALIIAAWIFSRKKDDYEGEE